LKLNTIKYIFLLGTIIFFVACSTKKNTFLSRNTHALSTKYNILYNGGIALDKGITDLKSQYQDNFWELLPVERMIRSEEELTPNQTKNTDFERAEEKSVKAIQKHSMNIGGTEKNHQMDEAHLMLGKTRYYDKRYIPALEAFNYVLYKYPSSDKIYEIKIWREKTNMRLENDALAIENLRKLLKEIKFKDQIFADANATLAQAFLNLKLKDSAISKLKLATEFTKSNEEKSRYRFILGQIYDEKGYRDSAFVKYQEVIDMKRKSARQYVIQSHIKQALQFDYKKGDTLAFIEKYDDLLKDRENRQYLDFLNHQMALFYGKLNQDDKAINFYNKSLKIGSQDDYLTASNYRNLAEIYFNKAKYLTAGNYYDSTLTVLDPRGREYKLINKKRENLEDVIKYEAIAQRNDSILRIANLSLVERENYFKEYIDKLKLEDKKNKDSADQEAKNNAEADGSKENASKTKNLNPQFSGSTGSNFYFYNAASVAFGKIEFKKKWGNRAFVENWRLSKEKEKDIELTEEDELATSDSKNEGEQPQYTSDFYIKQIPTEPSDLAGLAKERNFAYYQLGVIYKEKFKEYQRAADKLEKLLQFNPEQRLVLPSMYNLFKIYEIINKEKAIAMKQSIISQFPESRYAQILNNESLNLGFGSPEIAYKNLYKEYEDGNYREAIISTDMAIVQFTGEEMLSKFELLKANLIGKLYGLEEFKKALNFVALTYPNSEEGKSTEKFIASKIPYLESLSLNSEIPFSWKILYKADNLTDKSVKILLEKLNKFAKERTTEKLTISTDIYTIDKNFIVIHGIKSLENAKGITQVLKEFKEYKIPDLAIVISSENYKVIQIKKNIDEYISGDWLNKEIVPVQRVIELPQPEPEKTKIESRKKKEKPVQNNANDENFNNLQEMQSAKAKSRATDGDPPINNMMPPTPETPKKR
jgi:tetratricopeptide (TPR) repeat protein